MPRICCEEAMAEVEDFGSSSKFVSYGTQEQGDRLVDSLECRECKEKWFHRRDTLPPDQNQWVPADPNYSNSEGLSLNRYLISHLGKNDRDETWYYVEYCPETGIAYWVKEWHNLSYSLSISEGSEKIDLRQARQQRFYSEAVAILNQKHPEWVEHEGQ